MARAYYPQAEAGPHHVRAPGQEGLQDDVREVGLLGDYLLQPLAGYGQHLPGLAHHGREVHRLPGEHVQLTQEATREEGSYPPRLSGEVVDNLHLALKDDDEIISSVACPEEDVPDLHLPPLPVATEDQELVFPQLRGPRTANLSGSIDHGVSLSIAFVRRKHSASFGSSAHLHNRVLLLKRCYRLTDTSELLRTPSWRSSLCPGPSERRFLESVACTVGRRGERRLPPWRHRGASPSFFRQSSQQLPPTLHFVVSTRNGLHISWPHSSVRCRVPVQTGRRHRGLLRDPSCGNASIGLPSSDRASGKVELDVVL